MSVRKSGGSPWQAPLEVVCQDRRGTEGGTPSKDSASPATRLESRGSRCAAAIKVPPRPTGTHAAQREGSKHWGSAPPLPEASENTRCPARRQQASGKCPAPPGGSQEHALPSAKAASSREVLRPSQRLPTTLAAQREHKKHQGAPHPSRRTLILRRPPTGLP
ncbi:hypothetical protein NDU88_008131 [Pleurodeles waltl]|uniref:Uncharacterized protein n=1 Tax=Pleurodeles waltl TaxID=8319 RepID=A0AAV7PNM2_PLEWA|nr:hypothetical protein NDU88_008131 [Pleurodeles waltl]